MQDFPGCGINIFVYIMIYEIIVFVVDIIYIWVTVFCAIIIISNNSHLFKLNKFGQNTPKAFSWYNDWHWPHLRNY